MRSRFCFRHQAVFRRLIYGLLGLVALSASQRGLAAPVFMGLGFLPNGNAVSIAIAISGDGATVVGEADQRGFRWTLSTGMLGLGNVSGGGSALFASGASADGSVIVGMAGTPQGLQGFRWTATGMIGLGDLPGGAFGSVANAVSADGSVIVGTGTSGPSRYEAYRWTAATGMVGLGDLPGGDDDSYAHAVNANGSVICGSGSGPNGVELFRWTASTGMVGLGDLPGGQTYAGCTDISASGDVLVGVGYSTNFEAFRWTADTGMVGLGGLDPGFLDSWAWATTADGDVIVGRSRLNGNATAFIWDADRGMRELRSVLVNDLGLDLSGWTLQEATGISDDGRVITGTGRNPSGQTEAWLAVIPEPSSFVLVTIAAMCVARRRGRTVN